MIAAGMAAGALLLLVPALAQDAARRRRGGDHAAAQLHRAAVRVDDARRADEGSHGDGLAAVGGDPCGAASSASCSSARACTPACSSRWRWRRRSGCVNARTTLGYEMRAVGANARAARFAGMPVDAVVLKTALLSGALAGLAGVVEVAGRAGYLTLDMSPGYGYCGHRGRDARGAASAGRGARRGVRGRHLVGADTMSRAVGVPTYIADVIVAVSLLSMLVATMLARYKVRWS